MLYVSLAIDLHSQEVLTLTADTVPLVWLLGTGGTISLWASPRLTFVEHETGQRIDVHQNLGRIPESQQFVRTKAEQLFFVDSGIKTPELLELSNKINTTFEEDPDVAGVVVTHGTYTMEETAYWLHLTVKSDRPVVVTGCQRPPSAMGTDADNNLLGALILAGSPEARAKGVMICMNDERCTRGNQDQLPQAGDLPVTRTWLSRLRGLRSTGQVLPPVHAQTHLPVRV